MSISLIQKWRNESIVMAGRTPARSQSAWNRWDSDPAVTDDLEAIELTGGPLGDVGVERQTTFFDEMRQARVARRSDRPAYLPAHALRQQLRLYP